MSDKPAKSPGKKPAGAPPEDPASKDAEAGRLEVDDRGNVTWQWTDGGLLADDTLGAAQRMQALVDPRLDVLDDADPHSPLTVNTKGLKSGYNPYNSGALGKQSWKKKKNLRELSKWIELRKKVGNKNEPDEEK